MRAGILLTAILLAASSATAKDPDAFQVKTEPDRVIFTMEGHPVATYVFKDEKIPRPYWCDVYTPWGKRVTRNHPPIEGQDLTDHELLHPGLWLSFGDLGGADFWRLKAKTEHVEFTSPPRQERNVAGFIVRNRYRDGDRIVCEELNEITIRLIPEGYLFNWISVFQSPVAPFAFGDQEEMGLGIRLHTPLSVGQGGEILNSDGLKNEKQVWGKPADWCQYSGISGNERVGILLMPSPDNFRRSWFHCRDYGLVAANPFGKNAFTGGEKSRHEVAVGEKFTLRYSLLVFQRPADRPLDAADVYRKHGK